MNRFLFKYYKIILLIFVLLFYIIKTNDYLRKSYTKYFLEIKKIFSLMINTEPRKAVLKE